MTRNTILVMVGSLLVASMLGCSSQVAEMNTDGSADVEGYNSGGQQGLPRGRYKIHLLAGQWYKDQAGIVHARD